MVKVLPTGLAFVSDLQFGELTQSKWHPVAILGRYLAFTERLVYRNSRLFGGIYVMINLFSAVSIYCLCKSFFKKESSNKNGLWGFALYTFVVNQALASNQLYKVAREIRSDLMRNDLKVARSNVKALVGRNPDDLNETDIIKAVIESVAENTTDAIISPLFYGTVLSDLAVLIHKIANTMDSMVAHKNDKYLLFGYVAAKFDDWANFVPARIGMLLLIVLNPKRAKDIIGNYLHDGKNHPSVNAGLIESGFATVLDVRLGGDLIYGDKLEHRPILNERGSLPDLEDIEAAINLSKKTAIVYLALAAGIYGVFYLKKKSRPQI